MRKCIKIRPFQVVALCAPILGMFLCATFFFVLPVESWGQLASSVPDEAGFALLVDISDYRDTGIPPLRAKSNEVDKIKNALHSVGGFPEGQIRVLAGENATREDIAEALTTIMERTQTQANARFLFYLKGRSLRVQGKSYFLPYNARVGAASTYIEEATLINWFYRVPLRMKSFIRAAWDIDDQNDKGFSSQLAEILSDEDADSDTNRKVTLSEVEKKIRIRGLGFRGDNPIRIAGNGTTVLIQLPSVLAVTSQPSSATILLDGTEKGVTPARLVGLTPGKHQLRVRKDRYQMPEEQAIEITVARGQRVSLSAYKLTPIRVYGAALDVDEKVVGGVEVSIGGTGYRKVVNDEGQFSFENWQAYGLLESGKIYEVVAQSPDGLYAGNASFNFSGTEDIHLTISLTQTNFRWTGPTGVGLT